MSTVQKKGRFIVDISRSFSGILLSITIVIGSFAAAGLVSNAHAAAQKDIVDTAVADGSFTTLVAAVKAAGLVDTLKGPGPFTVFAPTDAAFQKLPKGTLESLLKPENKEKLVAVLTFHVVPGDLPADSFATNPVADTAQGTDLVISSGIGGITVDGAAVVKADVRASNGVIHVIDAVVLPKDLARTLETGGQFSTLLAAAKAAGLDGALKDPKAGITLFAPTDRAFAALPAGTVENLLRPENKARLAAVLKHHILPEERLLKRETVETLNGDTLGVSVSGPCAVDGAAVTIADIKATNGVVQVIDRVLLPKMPAGGAPAPAAPAAAKKQAAVPTPTPADAMQEIRNAIDRGVPAYNSGDHAGCTAIYKDTAQSLLTRYAAALDEGSRARLRSALKTIERQHRADKRAWELRYALDDVYAALQKKDH
jgi:uncharacterized surface protein with fasciclin (FAS1) repeats